MMRHPLRQTLILALVLALTGMTVLAGAARGQLRAGGEVILLCSDGGLVQITRDATGAPTGGTHLCPDLAPGLIAGLAVATPDISRPATPAQHLSFPEVKAAVQAAPPAPRARAPPIRP